MPPEGMVHSLYVCHWERYTYTKGIVHNIGVTGRDTYWDLWLRGVGSPAGNVLK